MPSLCPPEAPDSGYGVSKVLVGAGCAHGQCDDEAPTVWGLKCAL